MLDLMIVAQTNLHKKPYKQIYWLPIAGNQKTKTFETIYYTNVYAYQMKISLFRSFNRWVKKNKT